MISMPFRLLLVLYTAKYSGDDRYAILIIEFSTVGFGVQRVDNGSHLRVRSRPLLQKLNCPVWHTLHHVWRSDTIKLECTNTSSSWPSDIFPDAAISYLFHGSFCNYE